MTASALPRRWAQGTQPIKQAQIALWQHWAGPAPVVLLLGGHPGGELGAVEGDVQALKGRGEAELQGRAVQVQGGAEQLLQRVLRKGKIQVLAIQQQEGHVVRGA